MEETIGEFLRFYGDALKLGESIDKIIRDYFDKRGDCLNIVGSELSRSYALKVIEERWGRADLCIRPAPEFKQAELAMFYDDNIGRTFKEPMYFFIPVIESQPTGVRTDEYKKIVRIASDYGAYASFVESSYRLTNEDLRDIIAAVQSGRYSFTINDGYFRDTSFKIKELARDVDALFHIKASIGNDLTVDNHKAMITEWYKFIESTEFQERLCTFKLYANENVRHRMFVSYLKDRGAFHEFVVRQQYTNPASRCKVDLSVSGDTETTVNKAAGARGVIKNARETMRYEWFNERDGSLISSSESVSFTPVEDGTYRLRFNVYVKSGRSEIKLASLLHTVIVKAESGKDCIYTYSGWGECSSTTRTHTRTVISKSPANCVERHSPVIEQPCTPTVKEPSACVYQYSEWSSCDEKTKKQTRRIISKSPANCIEKEKPKTEQSCTPVTKASPACSFKYSEWGECSRATKKQTRSVIAKEPAGSIEKQKPVLEQGCTPPPTEEEKRHQYFNCLCRCSSGWAGHIGVWYDPEGKTKPECESSGPCIGGIGAFGCSRRHFFNAPNDCAKGCWEGAFGKDTYDANKADKMRKDENKKYAKPLTVKLKASKNPADFGDVIDMQAQASEGTGGYSYNWGGCAQDAKDYNAKVAFKNKCTPCDVSVSVTDQDGNAASDSLTIQCNTIKVKLTKESPKENNIPIGGKAAFFAEVLSGDKPFIGPSLKYLWERNPDAVFGDPKNPQYEQKAGSQSRNSALFRNIGTTPVWVVVQREIDGRWATIGESEQIMINVVKPKIKLLLNKKEPFIGEKVVLTVHEEPKMSDDFITFWWEYSGNISNPGVEPNIPNSRAYSFKPKDTKPVTVTVHAKAKDGGDDLGQEKITITPKSYSVAVSEPRYHGPKPRIWKCDTQFGGACPGLVEVGDTQFAVFRDIFMKATVTPSPDSPRYKWAIDPAGSCGFPGGGSEIKINCSNTGAYTVKVEVTNADGAKLGEAAQAVTVSVSQEQMDGADKSKDAYDKMQQAKQLVVQGKLDEAITLAEEASRIDPKNTEAKNLSGKWKKEREDIKQNITKLDQHIKDAKLADAEKELQTAQKLHPKYPPVVDAEKRLKEAKARTDKLKKDSADKLNQAKTLVHQGKLDEAISMADDALKIDPTNTEAKTLSEKWKDDVKAMKKHIVTSEQLQKDNMIAEAERELKAASALHPKYTTVIEAENRLKAKKDEINKKKAEAQRLKTEGEALERQGNLESAANKYKESVRTVPDKTLEEHIRKLETQIAQNAHKKAAADRLWDECAALARQGRNHEALSKCKESVNYWSDEKRISAVRDLENAINRESQKKAVADRLWDECSALAKQNRLNEALSKCRESLNYWSSDKRVAAVKDLENTVKQTTTIQTPIAPPVTPPADPVHSTGKMLFNNGNISGVYNNPTKPTTFNINQPHVITLIQNYHWNNAKGSAPGTIGLRDQNGRTYGPWQSKGSPGQGGAPNVYWTVYPNITLPAGTYTIIDSNPSTWAQNSGSNGAGHTRIEGYPVSSAGNQQTGGQSTGNNPNQSQKNLTAEFKNSSGNQNIHIFVEGQDSFGPHNRITPGATIKVNIKAPSQGGFIKFAAGRNGQVLATCRWEYAPDTISGRMPVVTFNEPNRLSCTTGLR